MMNKVFLWFGVLLHVFFSFSLLSAKEVRLERGWNLVGSSCNVTLESFYNLPVRSVWVWDEKEKEWNFWSPYEKLMEIAYFYGIPEIKGTVNAFKGFWVQAENSTMLNLCEAGNVEYSESFVPIYGVVRWIELEGGFYGIEDITGAKYLPINSESWVKDNVNKCVKGVGVILKNSYSFYQWGVPVEIISLLPVPCSIETYNSTDNATGNFTEPTNSTFEGGGKILSFYPVPKVKKLVRISNSTIAFQSGDYICTIDLESLSRTSPPEPKCLSDGRLVAWDYKNGWIAEIVGDAGSYFVGVRPITGQFYSSQAVASVSERAFDIEILKAEDGYVEFAIATPEKLTIGYSTGDYTLLTNATKDFSWFQIYDIDTYDSKIFVQAESLGVSIYEASNGTLQELKCCAISSYHSRYVDASRYPEILIAGPVMYKGIENEEEIGHLDCGIGVINLEGNRTAFCARNVEGEKAVCIYPNSCDMVALIDFEGNLKVVNLSANPEWNVYDRVSLGEKINDVLPLANNTLLLATDSGIYVYKLPF